MSDGIFRAGPFAEFGSLVATPPGFTRTLLGSFVDEPTPVNVLIVPVNCALDSSSTWPWKLYLEKASGPFGAPDDIQKSYEDIASGATFSKSFTAGSEGDSHEVYVEITFSYQAVVDTSISITHSLTSSLLVSSAFEALSPNDTISLINPAPGTEILTLPASVTPQFVKILAFVETLPDATGTATITLNNIT